MPVQLHNGSFAKQLHNMIKDADGAGFTVTITIRDDDRKNYETIPASPISIGADHIRFRSFDNVGPLEAVVPFHAIVKVSTRNV